MAAKVVEADAGVHTLAMSVAVCNIPSFWLFFGSLLLTQPVTSWLLYGS